MQFFSFYIFLYQKYTFFPQGVKGSTPLPPNSMLGWWWISVQNAQIWGKRWHNLMLCILSNSGFSHLFHLFIFVNIDLGGGVCKTCENDQFSLEKTRFCFTNASSLWWCVLTSSNGAENNVHTLDLLMKPALGVFNCTRFPLFLKFF